MSQVYYDVPLIAQNTARTCWWAAARMVVQFHRQRRQQSTAAGGAVGQPNESSSVDSANVGLDPSNVETFARIAHLRTTYLSPNPETLVSLLTRSGPLWYGGVVRGYRGYPSGSGSHAVVITGCIANGTDAEVLINDPWPTGHGARIYEPFNDFFRNLSAGAPFLHV